MTVPSFIKIKPYGMLMNTTKINRKVLIISIISGAILLLALILCLILIPKNTPEPTASTETTVPTQTLGGIAAMEFTYEGDYLTCLSQESVLGIDVSTHQGDIDWKQVRAAGIRFAMIRIGYRGTDQGGIYEDENAQKNYDGAKKAGILVGGYFFSQAVNEQEAIEEAEFALAITESWQLDLPLVYDWEYTGETTRIAGMTARQVTDCTTAFCRTVEEAGRKPMVYFNTDQARTLLYLEELYQWPFWVAVYTDSPEFSETVDMWQYTDSGFVPGISTNVDINLLFPRKALA